MIAAVPSPPPVLFLDYDGVLHPSEVWLDRDGRAFLDQAFIDAGHALFEHADALAQVLTGIRVDVVLATSWAREYGTDRAAAYLPPALRERVVGSVYGRGRIHAERSRYQVISDCAQRWAIERWLAVDDDTWGWPLREREHLVAANGLGLTAEDLAAISARLRALGG